MEPLNDTFYTPANCITEQDYIKVVSTEQEFQQVVNLMKKVFPDHWKKLQREGLVKSQIDKERYILGYFTKENKLIGSVRLREVEFCKLITLVAFQVERSFRRNKVASQLFESVLRIAAKKGFRYLNLYVKASNKRAVKMYKNWKFKQMQTIYIIESFNENQLTIPIPKNYQFVQITQQDYLEKVIPFFSQYFGVYLEIYKLSSAIRSLVPQKRVKGIMKNQCLQMLIVQSPDKKKLDIYVPEILANKMNLVCGILKAKDFKNYEQIKILGNLTSDEFIAFKNHKIYLKPNEIEHLLFYKI